MSAKRITCIACIAMLYGIFALPAGIVFGADWNIPGDYADIQTAISDAAVSDGDTLIVADGTYAYSTDPGFFNLDFGSKNLTVRSAGGAANCILDAGGTTGVRFIYFNNDALDSTVIDGFTFRNGSHDYGGAIRIGSGASPTIQNCVLENNTATPAPGASEAAGGAVNVHGAGSNPVFVNCEIRGNVVAAGPGNDGGGFRIVADANVRISTSVIDDNDSGYSGGGIVVGGAALTIDRSEISNNTAPYNGGGIAADNNVQVTIESCVIADNSAGPDSGKGGALRFSRTGLPVTVNNTLIFGNSASYSGVAIDGYQVSPVLTNCTITRNNAVPGMNSVSLFHGHELGEPIVNPTDFIVFNSIIYDNAGLSVFENEGPLTTTTASLTVAYSISPVGDYADGGNNQTGVDPLFTDSAAGDFTLQAASAAIDAGDNSVVPADTLDLDGNSDTAGPTPYDLGGLDRFSDTDAVADSGSGTAPIVDMGAYEFEDGISATGDSDSGDTGGSSGSSGVSTVGSGGGGGCFISSIMGR